MLVYKLLRIISFKNKGIKEKFYVLQPGNNTVNLLGRNACCNLGIIKFVQNINIDSDLFGFGKWDTPPVTFHLKSNAIPYAVRTARNIAIPMMKPV